MDCIPHSWVSDDADDCGNEVVVILVSTLI
jgi:hypothetical protein